MSILITGATGYIGSALTFKLAEKGQDVRILCRKMPEQPEFRKPNIKMVLGDIHDKAALREAMSGIRQVYHMAAFARLWSKDKNTFHDINVEGAANVFQAALEAGVQKLVHTSTAGVIGPSDDKPMTEDRPRITGYFNLYESTKAESERLAAEYTAKGLPVVVVNPSRVYGPGLDTVSNPVTKIVERYIKGDWKVTPGSGNDVGSYCYIDDVVDGHIGAMEKGRPGERYIMGGVNATYNELLGTISRLSGVHNKQYHVPFFLLKLASRIMLFRAELTGSPPLVTPDWVAKYAFNWALDSSKAQREIGYAIRPLAEGIGSTIEWVRKNRMG
jgi:nucleoside-diphosphate-sugar epimerase